MVRGGGMEGGGGSAKRLCSIRSILRVRLGSLTVSIPASASQLRHEIKSPFSVTHNDDDVPFFRFFRDVFCFDRRIRVFPMLKSRPADDTML